MWSLQLGLPKYKCYKYKLMWPYHHYYNKFCFGLKYFTYQGDGSIYFQSLCEYGRYFESKHRNSVKEVGVHHGGSHCPEASEAGSGSGKLSMMPPTLCAQILQPAQQHYVLMLQGLFHLIKHLPSVPLWSAQIEKLIQLLFKSQNTYAHIWTSIINKQLIELQQH